MRVLKWVVERARGKVGGQETLIGWVPKSGDLDLSGLDVAHQSVDAATDIDLSEWEQELVSHEDFFRTLGEAAPLALLLQRQLLLERVRRPGSSKPGC
jgi:phosphoenolpyruvate carboxykinase (GTP)